MRADAVFFGAHPDDIELTCAGLAARLASHGHRVALVDLTRGEAGSRGTPEARAAECAAAAQALGVASRESLGLPDLGLDRSDRTQLASVVSCLRRWRPTLVVAPHRRDPHPDHVEASHLVTRACHHAGLLKFDGPAERHRPDLLLHVLYRGFERPHLVVDVTESWERRMQALRAHRSQLEGDGPATYLTHPDFLAEVEARARVFGAAIGARYGEGYRLARPLRVADARALLSTVPSEVSP
jgi:bacillithiol biosynthesis deacetylase BshB1